MPNYFNPQSVAPQIPNTQLGGALYGAWEVDRNEMYKRAMGLQELMQQEELSGKRDQNDRYRQLTPYEVMQQRQRGLEARAKEPYVDELARGEAGKAQQEAVKGRIAQGTERSDIARKNAENELTTLEKGARMLEAYGPTGMLEAQEPYAQFRSQLSPKLQAMLPPHYTPDTTARIQKLSQGLSRWLQNTPEHRQVMEKQERQGEIESDRTFISNTQNNEAALGRQMYASDAQVRAAQERGDRPGVAETKDKAVARLRMELPRDPFNQEKIMEYRSHLEDIWGKNVNDDMGLAMLKFRALNSEKPEDQRKAAAAYEQKRQEFFAERGIYLKAPKDGEIRVHPQLGRLRWKNGYGRNPADLNNWERLGK